MLIVGRLLFGACCWQRMVMVMVMVRIRVRLGLASVLLDAFMPSGPPATDL